MRRERPFLPLLRDAALVAGVAVLTVQALRRWVGDRYTVPSDSMEPVLHGDPEHGDVVFVDKLASAAGRRRHDLVVVRHPEQPGQQLVKRIVARGDDLDACCIDLIGGDVWLGPAPDRKSLRREVKQPAAAREMRVRWAAWPAAAPMVAPLDLSAAQERDGELVLPPLSTAAAEPAALLSAEARRRRHRDRVPGALPIGSLGTAQPVDATFVDAAGVRGRAGADVGVVDCGMDLVLAAPVDELLGTVELRDQALTFRWRPKAGAFALCSDGVVVHEGSLPQRPGAHRVEFGLLDDRMFLCLDGREDATVAIARRPEWPASAPDGRTGEPRTHVHVLALGALPLRLARLEVFRDVYHTRERIVALAGQRGDWPRCLPSGTWFLLGDNCFDSRDSRQFGPVPAVTFVGVPRAVLGPWPRPRWLP